MRHFLTLTLLSFVPIRAADTIPDWVSGMATEVFQRFAYYKITNKFTISSLVENIETVQGFNWDGSNIFATNMCKMYGYDWAEKVREASELNSKNIGILAYAVINRPKLLYNDEVYYGLNYGLWLIAKNAYELAILLKVSSQKNFPADELEEIKRSDDLKIYLNFYQKVIQNNILATLLSKELGDPESTEYSAVESSLDNLCMITLPALAAYWPYVKAHPIKFAAVYAEKIESLSRFIPDLESKVKECPPEFANFAQFVLGNRFNKEKHALALPFVGYSKVEAPFQQDNLHGHILIEVDNKKLYALRLAKIEKMWRHRKLDDQSYYHFLAMSYFARTDSDYRRSLKDMEDILDSSFGSMQYPERRVGGYYKTLLRRLKPK
eukprot:NODE_66_length_23959_cov_0.323009.p5 type:complete len:380 gc:universal NODE_66_length_23959_cov_0.323009:16338-15199(-)